MTRNRKLVFSALCIALGIVLPIVLHAIPNAGSILLPMHIPVLLAGLVCGPWWGLACGAITPALSSMLTGMPGAPILPSMICELAAYGLVAGGLMLLTRSMDRLPRLYVCLAGAMLVGRVINGLVHALIFNVGAYSIQVWVTSCFVTALPGILIQLLLLPALVLGLRRAQVIAL